MTAESRPFRLHSAKRPIINVLSKYLPAAASNAHGSAEADEIGTSAKLHAINIGADVEGKPLQLELEFRERSFGQKKPSNPPAVQLSVTTATLLASLS